jgi:hypothetical protein
MLMNCKEFGINLPWPKISFYPGIRLEGLRKTRQISMRIAGLRAEI